MITINLPFPVSQNSIYATDFKTKRRFKSKDYKQWLTDAGKMINAQRPGKIKGPYTISFLFERRLNKDGSRNKRRIDGSNLEKGVNDLLVKHGIIEDDSLEEEAHRKWSTDVEGCRVILEPYDA